MEAPICPLCKIRTCDADTEPGREPSYYGSAASYSTYCTTCSMLSGTRTHAHQHYGSPVQVAAGTVKAGHSWRTTELLRPIWRADGKHVGFRCDKFDQCGWQHYFTPEELEPCPVHTSFPDYPQIFGVCRDYLEHRIERGECDPHPRPYMTEFGRKESQRRSDEQVWDPGKYIEYRGGTA